MSDSEEKAARLTTTTTQVVTIASVGTTVVILIVNLDVTATIFKVIQLITIFDKLRFMNVKIKNSFGDFIEFIGRLFEVKFINKEDYHEASIIKQNKFKTANFSVIAYRTKPDKIILYIVVLFLQIIIACLASGLKTTKKTDFMGIEKRGKLIRRLNKISSGMFMMVVIDVLFVTGHQILHQNISKLLTKAEYFVTYILSLIMFLCCIWRVCSITNTLSRSIWSEVKRSNEKKETEKEGTAQKNQTKNSAQDDTENVGSSTNKKIALRCIGTPNQMNPSELDPLGVQSQRQRGKEEKKYSFSSKN